MKIKQFFHTETRNAQKTSHNNNPKGSSTRTKVFSENHDGSESEKKLCWLRSQIIGADSQFESPFGIRKLIYADHTASGRSLHYIEDFIINNVLPFYGNTHTCESYVGNRTTKMVHEATQYIKRCLGGGEEDAIMFCGSGTTAAIKRLQEVMGIAVPSILRERLIKTLSNEERWVVFVGPYEHHSNLLSWRQSLAEVVEIGLDDNGLIDIEALRLKLESYKDSNRPLLGSFSACSNVTGIYSDTKSIATLLHQYGAFACFDFAASGPYVEIEMRSGEVDGYDAIFLSTHKFLGGPATPGILLISNSLYLLNSSPPSTCGGGTVNYVNGFNNKDTLYLDDIEERENGGTPQIVQVIRAALAFWVKEYIGYQVIHNQEEMYIQKALQRLLPNENIQARGGCACAGPYGHSLLDFDEIRSHKIRSAIQKGYVGVKPGWTRISFPYYMSNEEFDFIVAAVELIAIYGQRFLSLYHFNLKTGHWSYENNRGIHIKHVGMMRDYDTYLETARHIAKLLPKFPTKGSLPEDIDPDILHFRI
ncbi:hypothetical protein LWI29_004715 [Acer saccharum]|uniref:Aminotransferase class V domain-containing protein n=1 Tax=Acer saccharum TaxID=4024 RepID=A0AA39T0N6_ACESA|nr:hypothetical protein LWI29_004715 [Acer saccharum]